MAMQAMQRHPQRTRGSKQGMSFDAGDGGWVRWTVRAAVGLAAGEAHLENTIKTLSATSRSERQPAAQQIETKPRRPPSVNPFSQETTKYEPAVEVLGGSPPLQSLCPSTNSANTRSPLGPANGAVPSAAMPSGRGPFPLF
ncbi:hypothetical protein TgHK011_002149 [Trichoderma gracile]|nr:hypothetical protein TgHK011_002149 [Trichoderma gracile]